MGHRECEFNELIFDVTREAEGGFVAENE